MPRRLDRRRPCHAVREVLSAQLDGEATRAERAGAELHLANCADCRGWFDEAAAVTRLVRTSPAVAGPDVTQAALRSAPGRWRARLEIGLRVALGAIGVAQLALAVAQMSTAGVADGNAHGGLGASVGHLGHESAAWSLGLAVGFLWVAARRSRPAAILPILTAFIGIVILLNAADLAAGRIAAGHAATHTIEIVGYLIVVALSRPSSPRPVIALAKRLSIR